MKKDARSVTAAVTRSARSFKPFYFAGNHGQNP